jgi:hypothetical protein
MRRRCLAAFAAVAVAPTFVPTGTAAAQDDADAPCPPGVPASATIRASDGEGPSLTATHTIGLYIESGDEQIDEFSLDLPPGVDRRGGQAFRVDAPGPVPVRATWRHFDNGSYCAASAGTTVNVEPAKPLRYSGPARSSRFMNSMEWSVSYGKNADLRPVEVRLRGVRRARLPGASAPVQTVTFALRRGDRGLSYDGRAIRMLRSAGWRFQATFGHSERDIRIDMLHYPGPGRGFGIDLELTQAGRVIGRTRAVGRCSYLVCRYRTVRNPSGARAAQATDPPCPPGVAPSATIRGFDVEDGGGKLTATHTIALEAHDRDGNIPRVAFSVPAGAQNRGDESNPAFSVDTPGPVPVTATWSHENQSDNSTCIASVQRTLRLRPAQDLTFPGLRPGTSISDAFQFLLSTPKNADLRPVEFRLRGVRRARLPGPGARLQTMTIALRRGDAGVSRGQSRRVRAAGWRFRVGNIDEHDILFDAKVIDSRRGRRGPARGFGYAIELVQAGQRVGRIRAIGRCGYLGCRWRALKP